MLLSSPPKFLTTFAFAAWVVFSGCESTSDLPPQEVAPAPVMDEPAAPPVVDIPKEPEAPEPEIKREAGKKASLTLATQAKAVGAVARQIDETRWQIEKNGTTLELENDSRTARLNGVAVYLSRPIAQERGEWILSKVDMDTVVAPAFLGVLGGISSKVIVLDPGHGGSESGAQNAEKGLLEKDLNLEVCGRVKAHLEAAGYEVVLTRYDDRVLPLEDRSKISNREKAGLFISIHFNGSLNADAMGLETYVLTPPGEASTADKKPEGDVQAFPGNEFDAMNFALGMRIQTTLIEKMQRADRGFRKARFKVLKDIQSPGALVECGFLTNENEALLVGTPVYREKISQALAEAIISFMTEFELES